MAFLSATSASSVVIFGARFQPTILRENASMTTAKNTSTRPRRTYVISATQSWLMAVGISRRATLIATSKIMSAFRCLWDKTAFANSEEVVLTHKTRDPLVIDFPALVSQDTSDSTITESAILNRRSLNGIAEFQLFFVGIGSRGAKAIVTCAAYGRQYAHPFNAQSTLLPVNVPDLLVDGLPEFCPCFRRFPSMRSKAPLKKSSSNACRATRRSRSAIRRRCRSSLFS